jgi:hypothetical protein
MNSKLYCIIYILEISIYTLNLKCLFTTKIIYRL